MWRRENESIKHPIWKPIYSKYSTLITVQGKHFFFQDHQIVMSFIIPISLLTPTEPRIFFNIICRSGIEICGFPRHRTSSQSGISYKCLEDKIMTRCEFQKRNAVGVQQVK